MGCPAMSRQSYPHRCWATLAKGRPRFPELVPLAVNERLPRHVLTATLRAYRDSAYEHVDRHVLIEPKLRRTAHLVNVLTGLRAGLLKGQTLQSEAALQTESTARLPENRQRRSPRISGEHATLPKKQAYRSLQCRPRYDGNPGLRLVASR